MAAIPTPVAAAVDDCQTTTRRSVDNQWWYDDYYGVLDESRHVKHLKHHATTWLIDWLDEFFTLLEGSSRQKARRIWMPALLKQYWIFAEFLFSRFSSLDAEHSVLFPAMISSWFNFLLEPRFRPEEFAWSSGYNPKPMATFLNISSTCFPRLPATSTHSV